MYPGGAHQRKWYVENDFGTTGVMDLQVLREVELFRNLDPVQLAHLASIMREEAVPKDCVIFEEGDLPKYFYVLYRGRVRISKVVPGMGEEALAILDRGSYFGEMELIGDAMPRAARATAHEDCILQLFTIEEFHRLLGSDQQLAVAILWSFVDTLSSRLRQTDSKVAATFAMARFGGGFT